VADVTLAVRFALDPNTGGVHFPRMQTKQNIMGFYNPIPPFKRDYDNPVLCVIYTLNESLPNIDDENYQPPQTMHIQYFTDR